MNLNASKKFVDSIRSDCDPSHGIVQGWTFFRKVVRKIVTGKNRAELFVKNFSFSCWFAVRPSSSFKVAVPHLSVLDLLKNGLAYITAYSLIDTERTKKSQANLYNLLPLLLGRLRCVWSIS